MEDHGSLQHLHHEGGFSAGNVVGGPDACEQFVEIAYPGAFCRDEGSGLGKQDDQGGLPQESGLSGHVGSGQDDDLLLFVVQEYVVWDIFLAGRHKGFDNGMASGLDVEGFLLSDHRPAVLVRDCQGGESGQDVEPGNDPAVRLDCGDVLLDCGHKVGIDPGLNGVDAVLGTQDLLFVFLEFFGNVAFSVDQRLLADPFWRNEVLEGVADFDVVAEHVVVADPERGDSRAFGLALLELQEIVLAS